MPIHTPMTHISAGALCRAAYDNNPAAEAESLISWGKLDKAEAQRFKDFLKSFGSNSMIHAVCNNGVT